MGQIAELHIDISIKALPTNQYNVKADLDRFVYWVYI